MKKFIIREDTIRTVRKVLEEESAREALHDFDTGLCTLSPYMPSHSEDLGDKDCCGIFMEITEGNKVICNECGELLNEAIESLKKMEDCPVCHGEGSTTDHHAPCSNCGGFGKIG